jgi:hypothetical protein
MTRAVLVAAITVTLAGAPLAQDGPTLPLRVRATVMVLNAHPPGTVKTVIGGGAGGNSAAPTRSAWMWMTIDRWSTDDETAKLTQALKSGGTYALVSAIEPLTVGHIQINDNLRWPIRVASTWKSGQDQVVRLATNGLLLPGTAGAGRATDYPLSIIEFTLPPTGSGEGTLVAVLRAEFDDRGRIEAVAMPLDSGVQRLTNVDIEAPAASGGQAESAKSR